MTNDEYAARNIMKWPEKMSGWVTPEGFIDRAFWKPSQDRNDLWRVIEQIPLRILGPIFSGQGNTNSNERGMSIDTLCYAAMREPAGTLEAIVKAHKESEE